MQSKRWVFTLNNYVVSDIDRIQELAATSQYLVYGKEISSTLTHHLQGFIIFKSNHRLQTVKRLISPRGHYEVARGSNLEASTYCKKDNDFFEHGVLPGPVGKTNKYDQFRDWVLAQPCKPTAAQVALEWPSMWITSGRTMQYVDLIYPVTYDVSGDYRPYQQRLHDILIEQPNERKIIFIIDTVGNTGKSWFTKKFSSLNDSTQQLCVGKADDTAFAIDESKRIFFFDIPRSRSQYLQYSILEGLKDGKIMSNKYESRMKILLNIPHVVCFMNERPDMNALSADRYHIINWVSI